MAKILEVKYEHQADALICEVAHATQADLCWHEVHYASQASGGVTAAMPWVCSRWSA